MRWFLLDRIVECTPGESIVGIKCFTRSEAFFQDHFPGYMLVPGVLQIEMMATTGGKAIKLKYPERFPILGSVKNAKFYRQVRPGDQCFIHVDIESVKEKYAIGQAQVKVDGKKVSSATIMYAMNDPGLLKQGHEDPVLRDWRRQQENG